MLIFAVVNFFKNYNISLVLWATLPNPLYMIVMRCNVCINSLMAVISLFKISTVISVIDGLLRLAVISTVPLLSLT